MKIDKKLSKGIFLIGTPIVLCAAGVGIYYSVSKKSSNSNEEHSTKLQTTETKSIYGMVDVFPKLNSYDFYSDIRIENGEAVITDDFIASVVNKVIKDVKVTDGNINWSYNLDTTKKNLSVTFNWDKGGNNNFWKTYTFSLSV